MNAHHLSAPVSPAATLAGDGEPAMDGESVMGDSAPAECATGRVPIIRSREEHTISRRDIDEDALKVLYRLARANYTAYLVGGGVRDLLLGRKPKDFDISTNAKPEQIKALFRNCILIGRRFRLAHIRYGEKIIETSTFRTTPKCQADPNDPDADLFQRDDNLFGSPEEDAVRRDFTVNGLFYDIESFSIIDYVGGMEDLAARRIRSIGDPNIRFREDPVRMVRAVRFASRLGFTIDPETMDAIHRHGDELAKASPARMLEEITRLFAFSSGERAVRLLYETGLLAVIMPELSEALEHETIDTALFWRRLQALDTGDTVLPEATPALIFATLFLEPLKLHLDRDWNFDTTPKFKFDKVRAFLDPVAQRLRFPRKLVDRIVHMYFSQHRFSSSVHRGKRGSIANFVTQDAFHESLALAEIVLASEGGQHSRLKLWRDMLAERMYGRDESPSSRGERQERERHHDRDRNQPLRRKVEEILEKVETEDSVNGAEAGDFDDANRRLSRSARRRRNKRLRKLQNSEERPIPAPEVNTGSGRALEDAPKPVELPEAAPEDVTVQEESSEPARPSRQRRARGRKKAGDKPVDADTVRDDAPAPAPTSGKKTETDDSTASAKPKRGRRRSTGDKHAATPASVTDDSPVEEYIENPTPLKAASFWATTEPEPVKKSRAKKPKAEGAAKKKTAKAKAEPAPAKTPKPAPEKKPLAIDKADEADIPMHWLDEI